MTQAHVLTRRFGVADAITLGAATAAAFALVYAFTRPGAVWLARLNTSSPDGRWRP